jgi:hypothetical protein
LSQDDCGYNKKNALLVRIGEKEIIESTLNTLESMPISADKRPDATPSNQKSKKQKYK